MATWLILSPPATHSRKADTAITACAPYVCLICICSFVITKNKKAGEGKQESYFCFFSPLSLSLSVNNWTKVRESKDTRREEAENTNTEDCQPDCDKTFAGELSPCHKALLF